MKAPPRPPPLSGASPSPVPLDIVPTGPVLRDGLTGELVCANAISDLGIRSHAGPDALERAASLVARHDWFSTLKERLEPDGRALAVDVGRSDTEDEGWLGGYGGVLLDLAQRLALDDGQGRPDRVAVIGHLFDRNEADCQADIAGLRGMLGRLGLELVSAWPSGGPVAGLEAARDADVVISLPYARAAAQVVAERVGARLIECELPLGLAATERWLRRLGEALGRADEAERLIDAELSEIVPALEWQLPFHFQSHRWAFVGDGQLAAALGEIAHTTGATLACAVVGSQHGIQPERAGAPAERLVTRDWETASAWLGERILQQGIDTVFTTSDVTFGPQVASVPIGFPCVDRHALFERPLLGFAGFRTLVDRITNAALRHQLRQVAAQHESASPRGAPARGGTFR